MARTNVFFLLLLYVRILNLPDSLDVRCVFGSEDFMAMHVDVSVSQSNVTCHFELLLVVDTVTLDVQVVLSEFCGRFLRFVTEFSIAV